VHICTKLTCDIIIIAVVIIIVIFLIIIISAELCNCGGASYFGVGVGSTLTACHR
jgi:hypothetical protein